MNNQTNQVGLIHQSQIISGTIKPRHLTATILRANGDLYYSDGTNFVKLPIGTTNQTLQVVGGVPAWQSFIPPKYTTTQRNAIVSPIAGMIIYNTTTNKLNVYTTGWEAITSA